MFHVVPRQPLEVPESNSGGKLVARIATTGPKNAIEVINEQERPQVIRIESAAAHHH